MLKKLVLISLNNSIITIDKVLKILLLAIMILIVVSIALFPFAENYLFIVFIVSLILKFFIRRMDPLIEANSFSKLRKVMKVKRGYVYFSRPVTLEKVVVTVRINREGKKLVKDVSVKRLGERKRIKGKVDVSFFSSDNVKVVVNVKSKETPAVIQLTGYEVVEFPNTFITFVERGYYTENLPDSIPVYYESRVVGVYEISSIIGNNVMIVRCIEGCDSEYRVIVHHAELIYSIEFRDDVVIPYDFDDDYFIVTTFTLFSEDIIDELVGDDEVAIRGNNTIVITIHQKFNDDILTSETKVVSFEKIPY